MIQIQPFTFPADSASAPGMSSPVPGTKASAFTDFLGVGLGANATPAGIAKVSTQGMLFTPQRSTSEALTLISGTPVTKLSAEFDAVEPPIQSLGTPLLTVENAVQETAAFPPPTEKTQPGTATPVPEAGKPTVPATHEAQSSLGEMTVPENPEGLAKADNPVVEEEAAEAAAIVEEAGLEADDTTDRAGEAGADQAASTDDAPAARPTIAQQTASPAVTATPPAQAVQPINERKADPDGDAKAVQIDAPTAEKRQHATQAETVSVGRQAAPDQARSGPPANTADNFVAQVDGADGGPAAGFGDGGLKTASHAGAIQSDPKVSASAHSAVPDTISGRPGEIGRQLGVEIARHTAEGRDGLTIRLDPAELGRIHIRMHFDEAGQLRAHVSADSAVALDMLRRDSSDLSRALGDAGVRTDSQSFQFDSRGQQREQHTTRNQPEWARSTDDSAADSGPEVLQTQRRSNPNGALDLFA